MHSPNSSHVPMMHHAFRRLLIALFLSLSFVLCAAPAQADANFLAPEQAFKFSAQMADAQTLEVSYIIADGYYMYRERFHFKADQDAVLGQPVFPDGKIKYDETFKKNVETYRNKVSIRIPVKGDAPFRLTVTSQGCTDKGLCYSPMDVAVQLFPISTAAGNTMSVTVAAPATTDGANPNSVVDSNDIGGIQATLQSGKLLLILPLLFLLGLGLSLTPCMLPMVPILSSIIVGEGARSTRGRGLLLSAVYALGMALVYTALGVAAGLVGQGLAATLQNPWVLSLFALLLIGLSLSMFGFYELQIPSAWQTRLSQASGGKGGGGGKLIGVFVMGAISALIVGPCVAPPLAGVLLYISQSHDVFIGGSALFAMAAGMSVPLLLVGVSAGALLPRAGGWMEGVKRFFGVLMLATALWMIMPVIPGAAAVLAWALLLIGYGAYMLWAQPGAWLTKAVGVIALILGALQLVNVSTGGRDALAPLAQLGGGGAAQPQIDFRHVKSEAELDEVLAQTGGKAVMLDFYADWCVSCLEMEKTTFADPQARAALGAFVLLKADVTANNADDKALLKRFKLFGPPGFIFFDAKGQELADKNLIGYENTEQFLKRLNTINPG
ncbi:MAG: protein-disulfide reductase DsbD [Herbaspirillum sp.]|jgi:thiol:disulfide interchange protein DsbD|nr:protein-disulfide reductase DsbD [Herbaspirillum sp.]